MPGVLAGLIRPPPAVCSKSPRSIIPAYSRVILNGASQSIVNMQGSASSASIRSPSALFRFPSGLRIVTFLSSFCFCLLLLSRSRCLSYLRASRCRFRAPKLTFKPSKSAISAETFNVFWKISVLYPMMVLKAFWGSLGVVFGALGGVLEAPWGILRVSWGSLGTPLATSDRPRSSSWSSWWLLLTSMCFSSSLLFCFVLALAPSEWSCCGLFRICWMSRLRCLFLSEIDECLHEFAGFEV